MVELYAVLSVTIYIYVQCSAVLVDTYHDVDGICDTYDMS
jgi:hypothetical protein